MPRLSSPFNAFDASFFLSNTQASTPVAAQASTPVAAQASTPVAAGKKGRSARFSEGKPGCRELPFKISTLGAPFLMQQSQHKGDKKIIRIESLQHHFNSTGISNMVMHLLAILKIDCDRDDDSILHVVNIIVSIVCFCYDKISKIFATMPLSELSFHQLSSLFGHSEYRIELFKELAIIGISEEDTSNLFCSTVADPAKNFFYLFAGRIVPSQDKEVQEVQKVPTVLAELQELHKAYLAALN